MYMNYAQPTDIWVMLVGSYSINKFTNTEIQGLGHPCVTSALGIHLARCCTSLSGKPEKSLRNRQHVKRQSHGNNLDSVTKSLKKNDLSTPQVLFCKVLYLSVSMDLEIL